MRQFVRSGLIASIFVGLSAVAGAQAPATSQPKGNPAPARTGTPPPRPAILDQVLSTVNGEKITRGELYQHLNTAGIPPGAVSEQEMYRVGIEGLVNFKLVNQFLAKQNLPVAEKEIDEEYGALEAALKKDGQDIGVALGAAGITVAQVRDEMKKKLRWRNYVKAVSTDDNLKKYVAENKDVFNRTQVRASHIVFRVEPTATPAEKESVKQKLLAIKRDIDSNKITFADAANKYSEDDGNKESPNGGDLGYFLRRGQFEPVFTAAAFALKKGSISEPVETIFGFHLIQVTDRKDRTPVEFDQNKLLIQNEYATDLQERIVASERKTAKIDTVKMPDDLFPKAVPPDRRQPRSRQDRDPEVSRIRLSEKSIGRSPLSRGTGRLLSGFQIRQVEPSLLPELDEPAVGLGDPVLESRPGEWAQSGLESRIVEVRGDRKPTVAVGDLIDPGDLPERFEERPHRDDRAPDIERVGPLEKGAESDPEKRPRRHISHVLEVLEPSVADRERRPTGCDRLDRLGRLAGDPEVAPHAVDGPGS